MDKNLFIAFALSAAVILGYYTLFPAAPIKEHKKETKTEQVANKDVQKNVTKLKSNVKLVARKKLKTKDIHIDTPLYKATLTTKDGMLKSFLLKDQEYDGPVHKSIVKLVWNTIRGKKELTMYKRDKSRRVNMAGYYGESNHIWKFSALQLQEPIVYQVEKTDLAVKDKPQTIEMVGTLPNGLQIVKKLTFHSDSYIIDMHVSVLNKSQKKVTIIPKLALGAGNENIRNQRRTQKRSAIALISKSLEKYDLDDIQEDNNNHLTQVATWGGISDLYFVSATKSDSPIPFVFTTFEQVQNNKKIAVAQYAFLDKAVQLDANSSYNKDFKIYYGPKLPKYMKQFSPHLHLSQDFGWFAFIAEPLLMLLRFLQSYVVNWGVAIILLTIIVRMLMLPLAYKGMKSMKRMSSLNPRIKKIRKKYAKDSQKMNQEIMGLYKKNKVSPVGGCLPMIVQIPIFIGLYKALLPATELRHAPFIFWIQDLSAADYTLVLPLLMGISIFLQQMVAAAPALDATQAKMLKWMPLVMILFFLDMPSALVLYWVCSNIITVLQQWIFNKVKMPEITD